MRNLRIFLTFVVIAVLASAFLPANAQGKGPEHVGIRPDAPEYAKHGPFWVGEREFTFKVGDRAVEVAVWYPALNPAGLLEQITYKYAVPALGGDEEIPGHAIRGAMPDGKGGPYPLVLFSHGLGLHTFQAPMFTEHWASYGFVVIALNHTGSDTRAWFGNYDGAVANFAKSAFTRFEEVLKAIGFAETLTAKDGVLAGLIDMSHIAVAGHSFGAFTSMVLGGARLDIDGFAARCQDAEYLAVIKKVGLAGVCAESVIKDFYTLSGTKAGAKALAPAFTDPRIKAVIPMATLGSTFTPAALADMKTAVLLMNGTVDLTTPPEYGASPIYQDLPANSKALVLFGGAGHQIFRYDCDASLEQAPAFRDAFFAYCADPVWNMDRAHDLTNQFTTAFLLDILKGDKEAHKALLPDAVQFAGIEYKTTMK